jgi:hypothetical protein
MVQVVGTGEVVKVLEIKPFRDLRHDAGSSLPFHQLHDTAASLPETAAVNNSNCPDDDW